jgi:oligopeptide transport system ATP-binding protein
LEIKNLTFSFHTYGGVVKSVRDVSFNVREGEILGIVGESGCGKSVTSQCILKLNPEPPGFFEGGSIKYKGEEIITKTDREMRKIRGVEIGFIFQDPMTSLNPTMTVGKQIEEVFVGRKGMTRAEVRERALEILRLVGINEPERRYKQYPHELSGGMKQRVMIAIALVGKPSIIIADEPTTSLDVTIEAQILDLLKELRDKMNTSIILITHDLGVIAKMCDRLLCTAARWLKKERLMRSSMRRHIRTRQVLSNQSLRWIPPRIRSWCPSTEHLRICSHRRRDARLQRAVSLR